MKRRSCINWTHLGCYLGRTCKDGCGKYSRKKKRVHTCRFLKYDYSGKHSKKVCRKGHVIDGYCPESCSGFRRKYVR